MRPGFGKRTRESLGGQTDPATAEKDRIESEMTTALVAYFRDLQIRLQEELEPRIPADRKAIRIPAAFWSSEAGHLLSIFLSFINQSANGGVRAGQRAIEVLGLSLDWTLPFTQAADWAREYAAEQVTKVLDTTKERIRSTVTNWIEAPDMTLPDLWRELQEDHAFSRYRAELIAQTETTRAYAEGEMIAADEIEREGLLEYEKEWQTVLDGSVCHICEPLQDKRVSGSRGLFDSLAGALEGPPAHPGCRCWVNMIPKVPE